jgi:glycerol-3-phosphate dehydrogenase (NAD(P)+)
MSAGYDEKSVVSGPVAVIGSGSFGTALATILADAGRSVRLWARRPSAAEYMRAERRNPTYLPGARIPQSILITSDIGEAVDGARYWIFATPSHAVREVAGRAAGYVDDHVIAVSVAKGIENETLLTTTQVIAEALAPFPKSNVAVLSGPSHAEEVAAGVPTAVVVAAPDPEIARAVQELFMSGFFRVYTSTDVIGVEIAGSVKNVMAIAAGISDGVEYGDNAKAALITRGMAEIRRLGLAMGADAATFAGLAGIGDLVVTCMSRHSRNRYLGEEIGRGRSLADVESEMQMIAEGVRTTRSVKALAAKFGVEMPITDAVYDILFEGKQPAEAVEELMAREAKDEDWFSAGVNAES